MTYQIMLIGRTFSNDFKFIAKSGHLISITKLVIAYRFLITFYLSARKPPKPFLQRFASKPFLNILSLGQSSFVQ